MYTIGQISKMFNLPISTLRYYDKEGFFPELKRKGSIRYFDENDIESLRIIECLKQTGLEIKEIKRFIELVKKGPSTYFERKQLFEERKKIVEEKINDMQKNLALLDFKCWYYDKALKDGNEEKIKEMLPDKLPKDIQEKYDKGRS